MAQGKKTQIGDFCVKGHKIEGDNVRIIRNGEGRSSLACRLCILERDRARNKKYRSTERGAELLKRSNRKRVEKSRAERYDKILAVEIAEGGGKYTGLNYLKLNKRSQRAWEPLEAKFDQTKSKCYEKPEIYIDYLEDNPPTKQEAYKLCEGCPMLVECGRFANAYKPVIGVWAGEVWQDGLPIKTSYR